MIISLIAALDEQMGIGIENQIPWHLPADLARFKLQTMGHHLIAGRKTYQSIGGTLPGRRMIVLSRDPEFQAEGCTIAASLEKGLDIARSAGEEEVFIIGGAEIYKDALPLADFLYLTRLEESFEADVYFPDFDLSAWDLIQEEHYPADDKNPHSHTYQTYRRKRED